MAQQRLKLAGTLHTRAAFEPSTFDPARGTVEVTFTTGARGLRRTWAGGTYYEELEVSEAAIDLARLNNGASVLNAHSSYDVRDVIGVVERAWIAGKEGRALVRFSDREDVKAIKADVQGGILRHISVGYSTQKMEKMEEIEGVPVYRATRWTPGELSLVPVAFDDGAIVRGRPESEPYEVELTSTSAVQPQENRTMDPIAAAPVVTPPAAVIAPTEDATRAAADLATTAERVRATGIRLLVRRVKLGDAMADDFITKGVTLDAARAAVLETLATASEATTTTQHTRVEAGEDETDKFRSGAAAWLFAKAGATAVMQRAQKDMPGHAAFKDVALDPGEFRGMSLMDLARESLERGGQKTRGLSKNDLVGTALTHRGSHGFNTTSDFAVILENTLHKLLLASYGVTPDSWGMFCFRGSVADFRPHNRYRLGSFGALDTLNEHGEFKQKAIPDAEKQLIIASTKGNIISLSRQAIINDDMTAFSRLATMLGRAAKLSIELDVYALLAQNAGLGPTMGDGLTLFHATHANVGVGAAISAASIYADRVILASQKDPSQNEVLDLKTHCLCVPIGLGGDARVINEAQYDPDTVNKLQRPNYSRGLYTVICDTARLTGTRRYAFADPNVAPVIEVAFLDGQAEPFLDVENGWRVDGVDWKVRLDYGVGAIDFRGATTNAGV